MRETSSRGFTHKGIRIIKYVPEETFERGVVAARERIGRGRSDRGAAIDNKIEDGIGLGYKKRRQTIDRALTIRVQFVEAGDDVPDFVNRAWRRNLNR